GGGGPHPAGSPPVPGAGRRRPPDGLRRGCPIPGTGPPRRPDPPRSPPPAIDGSRERRRPANPPPRTYATRRPGGPWNPALPTRPPAPCPPVSIAPSAGWSPAIASERPFAIPSGDWMKTTPPAGNTRGPSRVFSPPFASPPDSWEREPAFP